MCRVEYVEAEPGDHWLHEPRHRPARKAHVCEDCGRSIEPGELYLTGTWVWGETGQLEVLKMCVQCIAAGRWLNELCGGHLWPGVIEELVEHWQESARYRSLGLGQLIVAARRNWRHHGRLVDVDQVDAWVDAAIASWIDHAFGPASEVSRG